MLEQKRRYVPKSMTLNEARELYKNCPTSKKIYDLSGVKFTVIRHYVDNKDLNKVIHDMAVKRAYAELLGA